MLAGGASVESCRVYLSTGYDFREKKSCLFWVVRSPTLASASYLATLLLKKGDEGYIFSKTTCTY